MESGVIMVTPLVFNRSATAAVLPLPEVMYAITEEGSRSLLIPHMLSPIRMEYTSWEIRILFTQVSMATPPKRIIDV